MTVRALVLTLAILAGQTPAQACWTRECVEFIDAAMAKHRIETQKPQKAQAQPTDAQKAQAGQVMSPEPPRETKPPPKL